ncbi:MAG TPA: M15 family metallopeptidase [Actinomycetota bacterium]|nr:M15 family metallopeptidase [Actinomycetota bacterium]
MRRGLTFGAGATAGVLLGAVLTLGIQAWTLPAPPGTRTHTAFPLTRPSAPETFLAWVPRGLPDGFAGRVQRLAIIGRTTVVAEDNVWLARSWSAAGELVDHPARPYRIPIDAAAVDTASFAPFLPPADRSTLAAVENGEGILGSTSASVRGLGPGAILEFGVGEQVRIAAVLPDELVGAAELLVSTETGRRIGIVRDRYLLVQPAGGHRLTSRSLRRSIQPLVPRNLGVFGRVQVRAPGETPYFRAGDAVLPPVLLKALFGEFAARTLKGQPGSIEVDPEWRRTHLITTRIPLLGQVTCHRGIVPQLRGAMTELRSAGLGRLIMSFNGCFVPRFISRDPTAMLSHHTWGIAIDMNLAFGNYYGDPPHQDPRLVAALERWGFLWGGLFVVPDGNHFEYHRSPAIGETLAGG